MAGGNEHMCRKSNDLLDGAYGEINYGESVGCKKFLSAVFMTVFTYCLMLCMLTPLRYLVRKFLPKPSEGPSRKNMKEAKCHVYFTAQTVSNRNIAAKVTFNGDPGYQETAKMIGECAVLLSSGKHQDAPLKGGVLTPATGFGECLFDSLNKAGIETIITVEKN